MENSNESSNKNSNDLKDNTSSLNKQEKTTLVKDNTLNIKNPIANISLTNEQIKDITSTITTSAGFKIGLEAAKNLPSVQGKIIAGVSGAILGHTVNMVAKYIKNRISNNDSNKNNYIINSIKNDFHTKRLNHILKFKDLSFILIYNV